jgi:hypothetical protein
LTPIWTSDSVAWFRHIEGTFNRHNVTDVNLRFDLVLPALPDTVINQIKDILRTAHELPCVHFRRVRTSPAL